MTPTAPETAPTVSAETPKPASERDPLLGANPDIMPEIALPPAAEAKPTEAAPAQTPAGETPKSASRRDPLLGADPDIMPEIALPPTAEAKPTEVAPAPAASPAIPATLPGAPAGSVGSTAPENVDPQSVFETTETSKAVPTAPALAPSAITGPSPAPVGPAPPPVSVRVTQETAPTAPTPPPISPKAMRDPLLGADPDIMPEISAPQPAPAPKPTEAAPAPVATPTPTPVTTTPAPSNDPPAPVAVPTPEPPATLPEEPPIVRLPGARPETPDDVAPGPRPQTPAPVSAPTVAPPSAETVAPTPVPAPAPAPVEATGSTSAPAPTPAPVAVQYLNTAPPIVRVSPSGSKVIVFPRDAPSAGLGAEGSSILLTSHEQIAPTAAPPKTPDNLPPLEPIQSASEIQVRVVPVTQPEPPAKPIIPATQKTNEPGDDSILLPPLGAPDTSSLRAGRAETIAHGNLPPIVLGPGVRVRAASEPLNASSTAPNGNRADSKPAAPAEPTAVRTPNLKRSVFEAGKPVARVGNEVITWHELVQAVGLRRRGMPANPPLTVEQSNMLGKMVLRDLIDRSIIVQEAKRELKTPKQLGEFMKLADRVWTEEELPPMLRQYAAANIYELRVKMKEKNESLDELRETYRLEFLSHGFMEQKVRPKLDVSLTEMRSYYETHLKKYQRPAQLTWREVVVETSKYKTRAEARAKADALFARLRRNEDFAKLAKADSDGPNKSSGGLWQTSPGSYGVASVNQALETLRVGELSSVIEGPTSFHIVRVDERRPAGPADFAEVQEEISRQIRGEKAQRESHKFLEKLRGQTIVSTVFDSDPNVTRASNNQTISGPKAAPVRR